ncbi:MAG: nucleotidyltransferase domain-containing protein [Chloroflexota bacterium]
MRPTQFDNLNKLLDDFTAAHQQVLGENLIGLYLQGSAAVGDMDEYSDVDFIAVLKHDFNKAELEQMRALTLDFYNRKAETHWAEYLEGSYFPLDLLRAFDRPEDTAWYNDNGSKILERNTHCNTLVVRWCLYEYAIPLYGPDFKTLIDPVPVDRMKAEVHKIMVDWGKEIIERGVDSNGFYQQFITGFYCRTLHTLSSGRVHSKPVSIKWARAHLDPKWQSLFDRVVAERDSAANLVYQAADPALMQQTVEFVAYAIEQANLIQQV